MSQELQTVEEQTAEVATTELQAQPIPTGVSPLVAMLASGQLQAGDIEKAMELQEKHERREAEKAYARAIVEFRKIAPTIKRDAVVDFQSSKGRTYYEHASLGYSMTEVNPLLGQCELAVSWHPRQPDDNSDKITVETRLTHTLGHSDSIELKAFPDTSGNKNPIQAVKSTITYLQRAGLFSLLGLAESVDDDGQAAYSEPTPQLSEKQEGQILDLLSEIENHSDGHRNKWLEYYAKKYGSNESQLGIAMPAGDFENCVKSLTAKLEKASNNTETE